MATKKLTTVSLAELQKRCPANQTKQFQKFVDKHNQYNRRVNKFPKQLPRIDWEYYRSNVRTESVEMVNDFEKKYTELNRIFDSRFEIDTSKYYQEVEAEREIVKKDYLEYVEESNKRIKDLEIELDRFRKMKSYKKMTVEEYCDEKGSPLIAASTCLPSYWPHTPDEQKIGPMGSDEIDKKLAESKPVVTKEMLDELAKQKEEEEDGETLLKIEQAIKKETKEKEIEKKDKKGKTEETETTDNKPQDPTKSDGDKKK